MHFHYNDTNPTSAQAAWSAFPKKNKYEQSLQSQNTYEQSQQQNRQTELNTPELPIVTLRYAGNFSGTW